MKSYFYVHSSDENHVLSLAYYTSMWFIHFPCDAHRLRDCTTRLRAIFATPCADDYYYHVNTALIFRLLFRRYASAAIYDHDKNDWTFELVDMDKIIVACEYVLRYDHTHFTMEMLKDAQFMNMAKMSPRLVRINKQ